MTRLGLFGGSFDPIHFGHLRAARYAAEHLGLERVVLIPAARPPHKLATPMTEPAHRLAMARLAAEGDALFDVDDLELHRAGPSYTFDTVGEYRRRLGPAAELVWFIGADTLPKLPTWYRVAEMVQVVRIVTLARAGWLPPEPEVLEPAIGVEAARQLLRDCLPTPVFEVSGTEIRQRIKERLPIIEMIPESVSSYIDTLGLYL